MSDRKPKKIGAFAVWAFCCFTGLSLAYSGIVHAKFLPEELKYHGKPIDPLCLTDFQQNTQIKVNLATCGLKTHSDLREQKGSDANKILENQGYTGATYQAGYGYSYYRVVGHLQKSFIVETVSSGGGSGSFTNILQVKRQDASLEVRVLDGGDRCNGGISDVIQKGAILTYHKDVTAGDFLQLSHYNPYHLKAYTDLSACAACCVAQAKYQYSLQHETSPGKPEKKLLSVDFGKTLLAFDDSQNTLDSCFAREVVAYQKAGKQVLDQAALQQFMRTFTARCIKLKY